MNITLISRANALTDCAMHHRGARSYVTSISYNVSEQNQNVISIQLIVSLVDKLLCRLKRKVESSCTTTEDILSRVMGALGNASLDDYKSRMLSAAYTLVFFMPFLLR